ncbi:MAG: sulfur carrier protein ThiS [Nannocystaceae bacterium]
MPSLVVNGERRSAPEGITLAGLVADLDLDPRQIAVERNHDVVPRTQYADTTLSDGDRLEIVTFVGGG